MRKYGLLGYPLSHSFSKKFFTGKFEQSGTDEVYENFEISSIDLLPRIIQDEPELVGLNVTIPYKEKVIPYLDELDESSAAIGAVNTIRILRQGRKVYLKGYNSDIYGFENSLLPLLKSYHDRALVLGTGGASKAVLFVLRRLGISALRVSTRTVDETTIGYSQLSKPLLERHLLIVNSTPLGTYPDVASFPALPYEFITSRHIMYDLVYNPPVTRFLQFGVDRGAVVKNGAEMLELQALKSYEIWNAEG